MGKEKEVKDNGNGKGQLMNSGQILTLDEDLKKALVQQDSTSEVNEPTKYILLDDALVNSVKDDRVKHFTKYLDRDEVLQMNDIQAHADLIEIVFGNTRGLAVDGNVKLSQARIDYRQKNIKKVADLFRKHAHDHMDNMMALDAKGGNTAKLLVMALRSDNTTMPNDKEVKRMFGGNK